MNRDLGVAACYLIAMTVFIYAIANPDVAYGNDGAYVLIALALAALHFGTGLLATRWWVVLLPLLPILIAVPAGYPEQGREPFLIWVTLAFFVAPLGAVVIAAGQLARRAFLASTTAGQSAGPDSLSERSIT